LAMAFLGAVALGFVLGATLGRWWALVGPALLGIVLFGVVGASEYPEALDALLASLIYAALCAIGVVVGVRVRRRWRPSRPPETDR
jgi:hypothetical protein